MRLWKLKITPLFAWYDLWIGAYYDRKSHALYIFPVPTLGVRIEASAASNSLQPDCCAALIRWLHEQKDEDDLAMINARDHGEWQRHDCLQGHRSAMMHVIHHLRAKQHNVSDQRPGDRDATKNKSSGIAGFAASDG